MIASHLPQPHTLRGRRGSRRTLEEHWAAAAHATRLLPLPSRRELIAACSLFGVLMYASVVAAAQPPIPPRNTGPEARAHSRYHQHRRHTTRVIRRTPAVMREDAARVKRGDLFSTWSNEYLK